jgi:hypothetical protein
VTLRIETGIALVAKTHLATAAAQTVNHATVTCEDSRSGFHGGEATTTTRTTMADEGGMMEVIDIEGKTGTMVVVMTMKGCRRRSDEGRDRRYDQDDGNNKDRSGRPSARRVSDDDCGGRDQ